MRKWFWLAILSRGKLRRPHWYIPVLAIFLIGILSAGLIYAVSVFRAVSERSQHFHVHAHSAH